MTMRLLASLQAQGFNGYNLIAMQCHQAMCRPDKVHAGPTWHFAVSFQLIGHDLGNGQLGQGFVQCFLQALQQR